MNTTKDLYTTCNTDNILIDILNILETLNMLIHYISDETSYLIKMISMTLNILINVSILNERQLGICVDAC